MKPFFIYQTCLKQADRQQNSKEESNDGLSSGVKEREKERIIKGYFVQIRPDNWKKITPIKEAEKSLI